MSDNRNQGIQNDIKSTQESGKTNESNVSSSIPDPVFLKHSLEQSKVNIPNPITLKESIEKK